MQNESEQKKEKKEQLDILAFGPHPDDVEFGCSGLLIKAARLGYKVGIIDMSIAENSTNGNKELRLQEADKARKIIGASIRENLWMENNFFEKNKENQNKIIRVLRTYRPTMILIPYDFCRHPDHEDTTDIIRAAVFTSGLMKYQLDGLPHFRPTYMLQYMLWMPFEPSLIYDITNEWDTKLNSLMAYESQMGNGNGQHKTIDNQDSTKKMFEARARHYGFMINREFGEPYKSVYFPVGLEKPFDLLPNLF